MLPKFFYQLVCTFEKNADETVFNMQLQCISLIPGRSEYKF